MDTQKGYTSLCSPGLQIHTHNMTRQWLKVSLKPNRCVIQVKGKRHIATYIQSQALFLSHDQEATKSSVKLKANVA